MRLYVFHLIDPKEPPTNDFNPDYTEELGDDLLGAMFHQTS
jgi:hypothetical protein